MGAGKAVRHWSGIITSVESVDVVEGCKLTTSKPCTWAARGTTWQNLQALCYTCHKAKTSRREFKVRPDRPGYREKWAELISML